MSVTPMNLNFIITSFWKSKISKNGRPFKPDTINKFFNKFNKFFIDLHSFDTYWFNPEFILKILNFLWWHCKRPWERLRDYRWAIIGLKIYPNMTKNLIHLFLLPQFFYIIHFIRNMCFNLKKKSISLDWQRSLTGTSEWANVKIFISASGNAKITSCQKPR